MVRVVVDSLSDLPSSLAEKLEIKVVPLNLHFGNETYRDNVDLSTEEFYHKLTKSQVFPTTSAPGPAMLAEVFAQLAKETDEILALFTSRKFSAIYEFAVQAKSEVRADCQIEVVDTQTGIGGEMLLAIFAAEAAREGTRLSEIVERVRRAIPRVHVHMAFDTLEYLRRGGRIGKAQAFLGSLLKVHPILGVKDGEAYPFARVRSRNQAVNYLVDFVRGFGSVAGLVIEDATTPEEREELASQPRFLTPEGRLYLSKVSPVVGAHVGPRVLAVSLLERGTFE